MRTAREVEVGGTFRRRGGSKRPSSRLTITELAQALSISPTTVHYRVLKGHFQGPGVDGLYDLEQAKRDFKRHPKAKVGRKRRSEIKVEAGRSTPQERELLAPRVDPTLDPELDAADPETRYRILKNRQEAIKLRRMEEESVDRKAATRRIFHFARTWRDTMDAVVSQEAPLGAAKFQADEGDFWRWLKGVMTLAQSRCAGIELNLLEDPKTEEEERAEAAEDGDEPAESTKPKRGPGRPRKGT